MNKIKFLLTFCVFVISADYSFAQSSSNWWSPSNTTTNSSNVSQSISYDVQGDNNKNNISDNVDIAINTLVAQYHFSGSQRKAIEQIARSYEYILILAPNNSSTAYQVNIRDVAATKCAESRLPSSSLDLVVQKVEDAALSTDQKRSVYERYINLLDENNPGPDTATGCEDEYSNTVTVGNTNSNTNVNYNTDLDLGTEANTSTNTGNISNKRLPCLILNQFMMPGSYGEQVTKLQTFLVVSNNMFAWPTGYFGGNTSQAVRAFQSRYGIDNKNPWAGPATRSKIAEITCGGDRAAMNRARNGYTVRTNVISLREGSSPIAYNDRKIIEISTTTITTIVPYDKGTYPENSTGQSGSILSSQSGFFDLSRNTVNPLYFTVRADASRDDLYVCIQPSNSSKCSISSNYAVVTSKYDPLSYDSVPSNDRWIFNVYYNSSLWGVAGGKIYFKNGIANVPNIYSVNIKQS